MDATQLSLPVVLRPAGPGDEQLLVDLLASLSPTSSFHRFLAGVATPSRELVRGLLHADAREGAVLAVRPRGIPRAIGHARWTVDRRGTVDVGVVVADDAQDRGIGTALVAAALRSASAAGAVSLHLDVHPDNRRLVAALRRRLGAETFAWRDGLVAVDAPLVDAAGLVSTAA